MAVIQGDIRRDVVIEHIPFSVGRKTDKDLVISDPRVSRDHAEIISESDQLYLVDLGSKHGTFVNGQKVQRHKLERNDRIEFGLRDGIYVIFNPTSTQSSSTREFLSQISSIQVRGDATDLEKLTLFLEAARKLNTTGVVDEILVTLLDATLRLTRSERGYVFLRDDSGRLRLAAGRNAKGEALVDDSTISHSILEEAAAASSEFVVSDTTKQSDLAGRQSIMAYDLRTVICIPLRKVYSRADKAPSGDQPAKPNEAMGVLYLDSRFASRDISTVSHDILRAIATEAAALVENAKLAQAEEAARLYQQELAIAAYYQQQLMAVTIPEVPFASLQAKNLSCKEIGGDFYDVIVTEKGLAMVITDVCGKGISAAILASIIQGMVYSQLMAQLPLQEVVTSANRFLCQKELGAKYATVIVGRLSPAGELEFVNCGHVQPLLVSGGKVVRLQNSNFPVGLLPDATYEAATCKLNPGDRLIMVTDGVTEAENNSGDFFGDERLEQAAAAPSPFQAIFDAVNAFRGEVPLSDDCTVFELTCRGKG